MSETHLAGVIDKYFSWENLVVLLVGDGIGLSLCIAGGEAFVHEQWRPTGIGFGVGLPLMAVASTFPFWKNRAAKWLRQSIVQVATAGLAFGLLVAIVYVLGPYLLPQPAKAPSADQIATSVADKLKPLLAPAEPAQGLGFGETQKPAPKHPSKNYSSEEKQALADLIGKISILLNDKGLPAAQTAQALGGLPWVSEDGLNETFKKTEEVRTSLDIIQNRIWNDLLPKNAAIYGVDLNYIIDNKAKFDQFSRATNQFSGQIINFQRSLPSLAGLIQQGGGELWWRTGQEFETWIRQCLARMDVEREGLK